MRFFKLRKTEKNAVMKQFQPMWKEDFVVVCSFVDIPATCHKPRVRLIHAQWMPQDAVSLCTLVQSLMYVMVLQTWQKVLVPARLYRIANFIIRPIDRILLMISTAGLLYILVFGSKRAPSWICKLKAICHKTSASTLKCIPAVTAPCLDIWKWRTTRLQKCSKMKQITLK